MLGLLFMSETQTESVIRERGKDGHRVGRKTIRTEICSYKFVSLSLNDLSCSAFNATQPTTESFRATRLTFDYRRVALRHAVSVIAMTVTAL